ncbi:MAG TPA: hypothetical protein VFM18_17985 [Methanosarcina sp.]|nr:hypothetical protein [Methanosarcina sp.]
MSLPSSAIYFDAAGNEVGREFVNCGWFCTVDTICRVLKHLGGFTPMPADAHTVKLYGRSFPVDIVKQYQQGQISSSNMALLVNLMSMEPQ